MLVVASLDWTAIILAGITAVVSVANGLGVVIVWTLLKTPSGTSIGKQVEDVNHTARSNWHMINATVRQIGLNTPKRATSERQQVDGLEDDEYPTPLEAE